MTWGIASLAVLAVVLLVAMARGWRSRDARTAAVVPQPTPVPTDLGEARGPAVAATYVSTTLAGQPFERVVAHGLGTRAAATVTVHDEGVLIGRAGAADVLVPVADLLGVGAAAGMAGKVVGGQGLVVLTWQVHDDGRTVALDTGLRTRHRSDHAVLTAAVSALIPSTTATGPAGPTPTTAPTPEEHP